MLKIVDRTSTVYAVDAEKQQVTGSGTIAHIKEKGSHYASTKDIIKKILCSLHGLD